MSKNKLRGYADKVFANSSIIFVDSNFFLRQNCVGHKIIIERNKRFIYLSTQLKCELDLKQILRKGKPEVTFLFREGGFC